jgi:hypothetical protein
VVEGDASTFSTDVAGDPGATVTEVGVRVMVGGVGSGGSTRVVRATVPENPWMLVTLIVESFEEPAAIARLNGLALRPNVGPVTVTKMSVEFVAAGVLVVPDTFTS